MPINREKALGIVDGDVGLLAEISLLLLTQIDVDLPAMGMHIASHDFDALHTVSHRLKGSLGSLAATPAYEVCARLEGLAQLAIPDPLASTLARLEHEIDRLRPVLREIASVRISNN